ncbi:MAG: hypothetical protein U1E45_07390 [Geminicoccaceae bacterium]
MLGVLLDGRWHPIVEMNDHDLGTRLFNDPDGHPKAPMLEAPRGWSPAETSDPR